MFELFVNTIVGLPDALKIAIAAGVLAGVRLLLAGRVPDEFATELAAVVSTALITAIQLALGLIPPEFEMIASAVLQLIAVLLGSVLVVRAYLVVRASARSRGFKI